MQPVVPAGTATSADVPLRTFAAFRHRCTIRFSSLITNINTRNRRHMASGLAAAVDSPFREGLAVTVKPSLPPHAHILPPHPCCTHALALCRAYAARAAAHIHFSIAILNRHSDACLPCALPPGSVRGEERGGWRNSTYCYIPGHRPARASRVGDGIHAAALLWRCSVTHTAVPTWDAARLTRLFGRPFTGPRAACNDILRRGLPHSANAPALTRNAY